MQPTILPASFDVLEAKASPTTVSTEELNAAVADHLAEGDRVVKVVHCRAYYSAVLLASGALLVVGATAPDQKERPVEVVYENGVKVVSRSRPTSSSFSGSRPQSKSASLCLQHSARRCGDSGSIGDANANSVRLPSGTQPVTDVAAGDAHIVYCTASGAVYTCGFENHYGQLGDGTVWSAWTESDDGNRTSPGPGLFTRFSEWHRHLPRLSPAKRVGGFGATEVSLLAQDQHGHDAEVNSGDDEGVGAADRLGSAAAKKTYPTGGPVHAAPPVPRTTVRVRAVSCGAHHTLLLTEADNCVYACGRGEAGQLGTGRPCPLQPTFRAIRLLFGLPIKQVLAAGDHSFVLLYTGKLFSFGSNVCGQLGTGHTRQVSEPTPVRFRLDSSTPTSPVNAQDERSGNGHPPLGEGGADASNGTHVQRRGVGSANSTSQITTARDVASPSTAAKAAHRARRMQQLLLDDKTYASLRAPYASIKATHFPLRARRLDGELAPDEPFILSMWGCATNTILLTGDLEWLSCGLPLTRGWASQHHTTTGLNGADAARRYDGYGALGRPLRHLREAYSFAPMLWSPMLQTVLVAMASAVGTLDRVTVGAGAGGRTARGSLHSTQRSSSQRSTPSLGLHEGDSCGTRQGDVVTAEPLEGSSTPTSPQEGFAGPLVECYSYPHATFVRLACPAHATSAATSASSEDESPLQGLARAGNVTGTSAAACHTVLLEVGAPVPVAAGHQPSAADGRNGAAACDGARSLEASSSAATARLLSRGATPPPMPALAPPALTNPKNAASSMIAHHDAPTAPACCPLSVATAASLLAGLGLDGCGTAPGSTTRSQGYPGGQSYEEADAALDEDRANHFDSFRLYVVPEKSGVVFPMRDSVAVM